SLDRISRQAARKAVRVIEDIVEAGITVVDLSDGGREYSAATLDSDPFLFIMMVLKFIRSNEESATKSVRVAALALQRLSENLPAALMEQWTVDYPEVIEELAARIANPERDMDF